MYDEVKKLHGEASVMGDTIEIYRDDSTTKVVYENVKHVFWTAGNSVLVIAVYIGTDGEHEYIQWPRERVCWFRHRKHKGVRP